jgi:hypothetical protein
VLEPNNNKNNNNPYHCLTSCPYINFLSCYQNVFVVRRSTLNVDELSPMKGVRIRKII